MLAISLPSLPPPISSLLPLQREHVPQDSSTSIPSSISAAAAQQQARQARRHPHAVNPFNPLAMLAAEERMLIQRKSSIATYGYSWLKPAGCTKTMLGRKEEEIEKEEVEKQLREAEMQEANQREMEEADRLARLEQQGQAEARGEMMEDGERDLDDDVPDADDMDDDEADEEEGDEDDVGMGDDLDDEIPEAEGDWAYDTTRELESGPEDASSPQITRRTQQPFQSQFNPRTQLRHQATASTLHLDDDDDDDGTEDGYQHEQEFDQDQDLDEDIPDLDAEAHDLDDDIPEAEAEDAWEHTDTSLSESDMDISILPPGVTAAHSHTHGHARHDLMLPPAQIPSSSQPASHRRPLPRHNPALRDSFTLQQPRLTSSIRSTSGNISLPPPQHQRPAAHTTLSFPPNANFTPHQLNSDFSISHLISTDGTSNAASSTNANPPVDGRQRAWLDPSSARRNLFGAGSSMTTSSNNSAEPTRTISTQNQAGNALGTSQARARPVAVSGSRAVSNASSGGLFTPEGPAQHVVSNEEAAVPRSRTRSGRIVSGIGGRRRLGR